MNMDRRKFIIRAIGAAICAGAAPSFLPSLILSSPVDILLSGSTVQNPNAIYSSRDLLQILKDTYSDDVSYNLLIPNPMLSLIPKGNNFNGKYISITLSAN